MIDDTPLTPLREAICRDTLADETQHLTRLADQANLDADTTRAIAERAADLITRVRNKARSSGGIEAFMHEYDLSSREGVILMCLAEALLRIPDADTADRLIRDKLSQADWEQHLGHSHSLFVNASTWGLMLTGGLVQLETEEIDDIGDAISRMVSRLSEPVIRTAIREAMRLLGHQFVMGATINKALARSLDSNLPDYCYSFDMLGEAALTRDYAEQYFQDYLLAIEAIANSAHASDDIFAAPGISIKLSALHPRFEVSQRDRLQVELAPKVIALAKAARQAGISMTIDMEEADRLDITLDMFEAAYTDPAMENWEGLGIALQTYQQRAPAVIDYLRDLAERHQRRIMLRLVKGAYWDAEIKHAQMLGLAGYPVFTRKINTDLSYQACLLAIRDALHVFYPQFATHNAYTIASILELMPIDAPCEFQLLHGMGDPVYEEVVKDHPHLRCRVYAPVGNHRELLPYLVRRLLENGANQSFINRMDDERIPVEDLIRNPVTDVQALDSIPHPAIPLPEQLFGSARQNSRGINFTDPLELARLDEQLETASRKDWQASALIDGQPTDGAATPVMSPADADQQVGQVVEADTGNVQQAMEAAAHFADDWSHTHVEDRARMAEQAADALQAHAAELIYLITRESGRTLVDGHNEIREAVDSCRYYAELTREQLATDTLTGPTGESNTLHYHGRGVVAAISPWNFPVAIFTSQVMAALMAGNTVVAKPARATPLTAMRTVQILIDSGIPARALQLLPGNSQVIGDALINHPDLAGVMFTGSTESARHINQQLAGREGPILPLVAETGGINCMIADSSSLPEQLVKDVIHSAFNSAGQRCSSLRVLFLQEDIAERTRAMLFGAMEELRIGDPAKLSTDVGPLINADARKAINDYADAMQKQATASFQTPFDAAQYNGHYLAPTALLLDDLEPVTREVFGPVLHIIPYSASKLEQVIDSVNELHYGLTLGIHSRVESTVQAIIDRARVGNIYVNRDMIGAVIGVQPFGGEGLSGTGPKVGGPNYLKRMVTERSVTRNTTAIGGNASLLTLADDDYNG